MYVYKEETAVKTKTKNTRFWLALVVFSLVGQVAWTVENMYFNVFIYKMFNASAAAISAMVAASAAAATVTTLLIGALSDKIGKRKVFICGGYIVWGVTICSFALLRLDVIEKLFPAAASAAAVGVSLVIIMDCVMTFFGSSANDAAFNAWLTEATDDTNKGAAEGINAMMPLLALLAVFGGFMGFDLNKAESWTTIFIIIGTVVTAIGVLGIFILQDVPVNTAENSRYFANIFYGFRPSVVRQNSVLYAGLLAFSVFNISVQIFMPYLILYYNISLGMDNYVFIMAPAVLLAAVFTAFYGRRYDRRGFGGAVVPALTLLMAGYLVLYFFRSVVPVFAGSLLMMCGYLGCGAIFGALVRSHTPENKAGMFQGLRIFTQVLIPGVVGPAIGAAVLKNADTILNDDGTTSFVPNANIFLVAFLVGLLAWAGLALVIYLLKKQQKGEMTQ